jgi:GrpB-like predicted nucleotidyltransferase (UPF0157 family)
MERYGAGPIIIMDYDSVWPVMFEQERAILETALGSLLVTCEHVGSTAVPGLAAKPIIDLLVGVRSLAEAECHYIEPLEALGYTYIPEYKTWLADELFFRKGIPGPWTHHIHMMQPSSPLWERRLLFRDYLRTHREAADTYANLKRSLAKQFGDNVAAYRDAKTAFIEQMMLKARNDEGRNNAEGIPAKRGNRLNHHLRNWTGPRSKIQAT